MKDPFAVERAIAQTRITSQKRESDAFLEVFSEPLLKALKGELEPLIKANKGEPGKTPTKGSDYFTEAEIEAIKADIISKLPEPVPGKDAVVDYDLVFSYVVEQIAKLPKPKDGEPGKDATVDVESIVNAVLKALPKPKPVTVDYNRLQELIEERIKRIPQPETRVVGYSSLGRLTDVDLTGVPQDAQGNYILTPSPGGGAGSTYVTPGGTIDGTNVTFSVPSEPKAVIYFGQTYFKNVTGSDGFTYSAPNIVMPFAPQPAQADQFKAVI